MHSTDPKPHPSPGIRAAAPMPTSPRERGEVIERESRRQAAGLSRTFRAGVAHHQAGRLDRAETLYRKVLTTDPDHADALHLLGVLAFQRGKIAAALQLIERALPALAGLPDAHLNYGNALRAAGRPKEAVVSFRRAIALKPDYGTAHNNLARLLIDRGEFGAALESARCAVELIPDFAGAHANCAGALLGLDRFAEAETALRRVLEFRPDLASIHIDLGRALEGQRRLEEAAAAYRRAIELEPELAEAHTNLGNVSKDLHRLDEAVAAYQRALKIAPDNAVIHNNLGAALREQQRLDEAAASFRRALALKPELAGALYNLGDLLAERGELGEAVASLGRAALQIGYATLDWCYARKRVCDWAGYGEAEARAREKADKQAFKLLAISSSPAEQLACAGRAAAALAPSESLMRPCAAPRPDGQIRIGYVSANFRAHAGAFLVVGLIEQHDRREFEIVGYSLSPDDGSETRARLASAFDRFVDISSTSDRDSARLLRDDGIDLLVDLDGYQRGARPAIFAYRPAPIQVTYLGVAATTGADFIDYIIADPFVVPADQQPYFSERLVHLPDCYQCNDDKRAISERTPLRAESSLPEDGFLFCCFNNVYKLTPDFFDIWMRLLAAVPQSVLWLLDDNPWAKANLAREATARGVAPDRIVFAPRLPLPDHLARHRLADLFLDTLPYNAHTTASDALWAGLPLVTCAGNTFAGRVAGSLLQAIGLPELVTHSLEEYEALALRLARDGDLLAALRARLARNKWTHPLFDTERFARNIEAAYRQMWETWRAGRPPAAFSVAPHRRFPN
jgi:predicted O-linked N-acetylglucosamine transferase (SPINDLY family)